MKASTVFLLAPFVAASPVAKPEAEATTYTPVASTTTGTYSGSASYYTNVPTSTYAAWNSGSDYAATDIPAQTPSPSHGPPSSHYPAHGADTHSAEVSHYRTMTKRDVTVAINNCANTADAQMCRTVVIAINGWDLSVNQVNLFLNTAAGLSGQALDDAEQTGLNFANAEPGFLTTLMNVPGLDSAGQQAAATLGQVFGIIPMTFQQLLAASVGVQDGINTINNVRCAQVLGNIGQLWISAAAAVGADTPGGPLGPQFCLKPGGNTGDAFTADN